MKIKKSSLEGGFIRLGCLGYVIAFSLLWGGGQGVYVGMKNRAPVEITVAEFIRAHPDAEWVTLKDARLNLLESAHRERLGKIAEIYIPVRPVGESEEAPVRILLETKNPETIAALEKIKQAGDSEEEALDALAETADKLVVTRDISGLIQFGIDSDSKTRRKLSELDMNLADNFVILEEGAKPDLSMSVGLLVVGVLIGFFMLRGGSGGKDEAPKAPPPLPNLSPRS